MVNRRWIALGLVIWLGSIVSGCSSGPAENPPPKPESAAKAPPVSKKSVAVVGPAASTSSPAESFAKKAAPSQAAAKSSSGLEPFKPPTLAELDAKAAWESQPVLEGLDSDASPSGP